MSDADWFTGLGLGVFISWGHASSQGWELSWQMTGGVAGHPPAREPVGCEQYFANAADFNPQGFDPQQWARDIKAAGASYVVFTAKHHDGFAMYDTALADYSITKTASFGRDIVAELLPALRAENLRVGLYFSIIDWHHPDYPRYTDETVHKPYVIGDYPRADGASWRRYRAFMLGQITELLTHYGPIDIFWLDGEFEHSPEEWDFAGIREHIRQLQPNCLVNDRCLGFGDFRTPEQQLPETIPPGPWEICLTMNESWGWVPIDSQWKSADRLVEHIVEAVSSGGNLLLNVGPRGDGTFPPEAEQRLAAIGHWLARNGESARGVEPALTRWQCRLPSSRRHLGNHERIYVYLTMRPRDTLTIRQIPVKRISAVGVVGDPAALDWTGTPCLPDIHNASPDPLGELNIDVSGIENSVTCPVLAIDLLSPNSGP